MVFSSITFIYYFLPIVLLVYFIVPNKGKNLVLLISSLLFYFYGEKSFIWVILLSCIVNYGSGLLIQKFKDKKKCSLRILIGTIIINLGMLIFFKYTNFFIGCIGKIVGNNFNLIDIVMPIGISFFTFQTLSYVVDVYKGKVEANKNFVNFACYVCLFPQLIAGPIVRYSDINKELVDRKVNFDDFGTGVTRFIIGLAKKVLIANVIGAMINELYDLPSMTVVAYMLIGVGYSLQIYFDFSGYSDMAIGLGRMLGFHFHENFNYPFIARSITDFWRRWHISLSSFFRDYIYIPLGGNRVSLVKHIRNILVVWILTGLWHGAGWNFIVWGIYFGVLLILEKYIFKKFLDKHKIVRHITTIFLVIISFIIFSTDSLSDAWLFIKNMCGLGKLAFINGETLYYVRSYMVVMMIGIVGSTPLILNIVNKIRENKVGNIIMDVLEIGMCVVLLVVVTAFLIDSSFNPFLYFRF